MLTTLRIKNLALVDDLSLELQPGYNVITGETGAGKSIIIGALNLILGQRADRTMIRSGADACAVEACFDISTLAAPVADFLDHQGLESCQDEQLILKRTLNSAGANRQFVNGSPATLHALERLGELLVDIHGPHDHQSLLNSARQLAILDAFAGLQSGREAFSTLLSQRRAADAEKSDLIVDEKTYAQQLDLLRFQTNEIKAARLHPGEDRAVEEEYRRAGNAAKLLETSQAALGLLNGDESSLGNASGALGRLLLDLQRLDPGAKSFVTLHEKMRESLDDLQTEVSAYADRLEIDPERLQQLEDRLNLLQSLKRKYGANLEEVIAFGEQAERKLASLEQRETELARIEKEIRKLDAALRQTGQTLSSARKKSIPKLRKSVSQQLHDLGFAQSEFDVAISTEENLSAARLSESGLDKIEFQFSPNPGEPLRPLRAIASSGELARVMLALKTVLAAQDEIPVLVFDEVDANVGGETAHTVGKKMMEIASRRQVLCITHLAPVAASATTHFLVTKQTKAGRTVTAIRPLAKNERIDELTRMLGGQSDAARKHAEALLGEAVG